MRKVGKVMFAALAFASASLAGASSAMAGFNPWCIPPLGEAMCDPH